MFSIFKCFCEPDPLPVKKRKPHIARVTYEKWLCIQCGPIYAVVVTGHAC